MRSLESERDTLFVCVGEKATHLVYTLRRSPLTILGLAIMVGFISVAVLAPFIAPYDPIAIHPSDRLMPPSKTHFFGTDTAGRDVFSRIVYGSRISLRLGLIVTGLSVAIGSLIGGTAAFLGGRIDDAVMRFTDLCMAFPVFVLAMVITASLGPGLTNVMVAIVAIWWTVYARLVRSKVVEVKEETYVEAARAIGASEVRVFLKHVLLNSYSPVLVEVTLDFGFVVMLGASLGFVGLGAQPPTPEWGAMISTGRSYLKTAWWYPTFPGLAIFLVVLGANLLGDGLRDILETRSR